jgi:hypothetical protein
MVCIRMRRRRRRGRILRSMITSFQVDRRGCRHPEMVCFQSHNHVYTQLTPGVVDFVDESEQVAEDLLSAADGGASRRPSRRLIRTKTAERTAHNVPQREAGVQIMRIWPGAHAAVATASSSGAPSIASSSPRYTTLQHLRHSSPATSTISSLDGSSLIDWQHDAPTSGALQSMHQARIHWPLSDPIEAHLFRFFVNNLAPTWDTTNSHSVFEKIVPQMALSNTMLLNAVLMLASQHINRENASLHAKPYMYHERVLQGLIPYLADHGRIQDEGTLVAAVFLRAFEEFHGTFDSCIILKRYS